MPTLDYIDPPQPGTEVATVANTVLSITTGVGNGPSYFYVACSVPFTIAFNADSAATDATGITNPADSKNFPAGVHKFRLGKRHKFAKVNPNAAGFLRHWVA